MNNSIAAIILTYNEEKHISRCINSLKNICEEIFVIDSFSKDRTVEIAKEAGAQEISERVWEACLNERSVLSEDRKTNLDYWVSYIAYFFDIYFTETLQIIQEHSYVEKIVDRIPCENIISNERMQELKNHVIKYIMNRVTKASKK